MDGKEKHTHPDLRWALGQSLSFATLVQGFHDNRETLWVVYNPHRNLGDAVSASTVVWNFAIPFNLWGETYLSEDSSINCSTFRHVDLKSIFRNELCNNWNIRAKEITPTRVRAWVYGCEGLFVFPHSQSPRLSNGRGQTTFLVGFLGRQENVITNVKYLA